MGVRDPHTPGYDNHAALKRDAPAVYEGLIYFKKLPCPAVPRRGPEAR